MPPRTGADLLTRLQRTRSLIEDRFREPISLEELAATSGLSRYHLLRAFREWTGLTPHGWQIDRRIQEARRLLDRDMPLTDIALYLGFADQSHFQRAFKQRVATTPGEYRRQRNIVQD
jgi:AraC-like DNA-binding protein